MQKRSQKLMRAGGRIMCINSSFKELSPTMRAILKLPVAQRIYTIREVDEANESVWLNEIVNEILTYPDGKVAEPSFKMSRFVALSTKKVIRTQSHKKESVTPEPWITAELMDRLDLKVWFQNLSDNEKLSLFRKRIDSDRETHYDALLKEWWLNRY